MLQATFNTDFGLDRIGRILALGGNNPITIVSGIINTLLGLLSIVALVMFLYGGFIVMLSGGNEERRSRGYRTIGSAIIGLIIILSSYAIVNFVINALTGAVGTTPGF